VVEVVVEQHGLLVVALHRQDPVGVHDVPGEQQHLIARLDVLVQQLAEVLRRAAAQPRQAGDHQVLGHRPAELLEQRGHCAAEGAHADGLAVGDVEAPRDLHEAFIVGEHLPDQADADAHALWQRAHQVGRAHRPRLAEDGAVERVTEVAQRKFRVGCHRSGSPSSLDWLTGRAASPQVVVQRRVHEHVGEVALLRT